MASYGVYYFDTNAVTAAEARLPDADFQGGGNIAAANTGIGWGTDEIYGNHVQLQPQDTTIPRMSYIGGTAVEGLVSPTAMSVGGGVNGAPPTGVNSLACPVEAVAAVADGGDIATVEGFIFTNQTGEDMAAGDVCVGVAANP